MSNAETYVCAGAQYVIGSMPTNTPSTATSSMPSKEGLFLREKHPHSEIKVRDLSQMPLDEMDSEIAA